MSKGTWCDCADAYVREKMCNGCKGCDAEEIPKLETGWESVLDFRSGPQPPPDAPASYSVEWKRGYKTALIDAGNMTKTCAVLDTPQELANLLFFIARSMKDG